METFNRKTHWEDIYGSKAITEVSWYESKPLTSLSLITEAKRSKEAKIIDVGGGDGFLVDCLLDLGYKNLTVLDISSKAIERAKIRLKNRASQVQWIISDITSFQPSQKFDLWHDRAAFHFLTTDEEINKYIEIASEAISRGGTLILGTFSLTGPLKCSGIEIKRYDINMIQQKFQNTFELENSFQIDHPTPFGTEQNFLFCRFVRK